MSGLFAGFLSNGPLELFRTLALNRRRFMTHTHLYSSTKKTLPAHFAGRQKSWPRPELSSEEKGRLNGPWLLPSPCTLPIVLRWPHTAQTPSCLVVSWALGRRRRRRKVALQPLPCLPLLQRCCPSAALPWGILSLHPTSLAGISPHIAAGRLISSSCGILYLDLQPLMEARKMARDLQGFTEVSFLWSWGP